MDRTSSIPSPFQGFYLSDLPGVPLALHSGLYYVAAPVLPIPVLAGGAKSEIGLQFSPDPIDEPILGDKSSVCGGEAFGLFDAPVQAVEIGQKKEIVGVREAAIFFAFEQSNGGPIIPAGECARD